MYGLWREFKLDVERALLRPPGLLQMFTQPLIHPGLLAVLLYRIAHRFWRIRGLRFLGALLKRLAIFLTGAEIHPAARIGGGLLLPHPQGVVMGPAVTIKGNCTIFQDVVLGARTPAQTDGPTLAPHTFIYPGARILGKVYIGARSQVGPNCVVYRDIPEGSTVLPPEPMVLEGLSFSCRFEYSEEEDRSRLVAP